MQKRTNIWMGGVWAAALVLYSGITIAAPLKAGEEIPLWPGAAPGSEKVTIEETIIERSRNPIQPDRIVQKVTRPGMIVVLPDKPNGASMIVASGGAYQRAVLDKEGNEIAAICASEGITVFWLKYRLPGEGHENRSDVPLQDAQRAIRLVRANASEWGLDPNRIGVLGFSAAGHMMSMAGTMFERKVYEPVDAADSLSARPDYLMLLYPVISMEDGVTHPDTQKALLGDSPDEQTIREYSTDRHVPKNAPPTLLILADDDVDVVPENSIRFYRALKKQGVPAEMHIYAQGKHGFSVKFTRGLPVAAWPVVTREWMKAMGMVRK